MPHCVTSIRCHAGGIIPAFEIQFVCLVLAPQPTEGCITTSLLTTDSLLNLLDAMFPPSRESKPKTCTESAEYPQYGGHVQHTASGWLDTAGKWPCEIFRLQHDVRNESREHC